jgi:hypothetical protein
MDLNTIIRSDTKDFVHVIDKIEFTKNFVEVHKKRTTSGFSSSDTALLTKMTPQQFEQLIKDRLNISLEEFGSFSFRATTALFDEALYELLYDQNSITPDNIEDRIIVPALNTLSYLDSNTFKYSTIDKYWDQCIEQKLLFKETNREWNNFYNVEAWCKHINTKLTDVIVEPVPEDNEYISIKPKGSSYWYLKLTHKSGKVVYGFCGFGHNFIWYN